MSEETITEEELADVLGWTDGYDAPLEKYAEQAASIFREVAYKRRRAAEKAAKEQDNG